MLDLIINVLSGDGKIYIEGLMNVINKLCNWLAFGKIPYYYAYIRFFQIILQTQMTITNRTRLTKLYNA